jgi:hypothetical protein
MEVRLDTEIISVARITNSATKPKAVTATGPEVSFGQTEALNGALAQVPDVRPGEVERAKAFVSTESYPPQVMMQKIARLLAVMSDESQ